MYYGPSKNSALAKSNFAASKNKKLSSYFNLATLSFFYVTYLHKKNFDF
jgi:hypothetical protein